MDNDIGTVIGIFLWAIGGAGVVIGALSRKRGAMLLAMASAAVMLIGLVVLDYVGAL